MYKRQVLQYFDTLQKGENGQAKADALLKLYNSKTRNLKITNAIGDTRVRAGSMVVINLALGDTNVKNFMLVEKVKHTFKLDSHFMDLTLRGGEFIALSLIHISEPTRQAEISYAVFCLKKKKYRIKLETNKTRNNNGISHKYKTYTKKNTAHHK